MVQRSSPYRNCWRARPPGVPGQTSAASFDSVYASADRRGARLAARAPRWRRRPRAARAAARRACLPVRRSTRARLGGASSRPRALPTHPAARQSPPRPRRRSKDLARGTRDAEGSWPETAFRAGDDRRDSARPCGGPRRRRRRWRPTCPVRRSPPRRLTPTVGSLGLGRQLPVHGPPLADPP
jgi:hypothetical protein